MLTKNKKKESELEIETERLLSLFIKKINEPINPLKMSWDEKTMIDFIDNIVVLSLNIITLLSRNMTNNKIHMMLNIQISKKVAHILNNKSFNKDNGNTDLLLSSCMEEGFLLITALSKTMKEIQKLGVHCFKDEIRLINYYLEDEWSFYKNNKGEKKS